MSASGPADHTPSGLDADIGPLATPEQEAAALAGLHALAAQPAPMPSAVWDHLEAALAAEPPLAAPAAAGTGAAPADRVAPVVPLSAAPSRRRRPGAVLGLLAGAAAAVVALVVGVQVLRPADGSDELASGSSAASSAPAAPEAADGTTRQAAAPTRLATGTDYRDEALVQQVSDVVAVRSTMADVATPKAPAASPMASALVATASDFAGTFAATSDGVDACLAELRAGASSSAVLVIDLGSYHGRAAAVVVVGRPGLNPVGRPVDVWVVGRTCGTGDAQLIAVRHLVLP